MGLDITIEKSMLLSILLGFSIGVGSLFVLGFQIFQGLVFSI